MVCESETKSRGIESLIEPLDSLEANMSGEPIRLLCDRLSTESAISAKRAKRAALDVPLESSRRTSERF